MQTYRSLGSSLVLLCLVACGSDATIAGSTALTGTAGTSGSSGEVDGSSTAATTDVAVTSTASGDITSGEPPTTGATADGTTGETGAVEETTGTTGDGTTTGDGESTGATGETGDEPPPADVCAGQDKAPPAVGEAKAENDDPRYIQVYVNNIENLKVADEKCPGDWTDLIYYMKTIKPVPDVFLVQQISNTAQLDTLVARMSEELAGNFEGVIADGNPWKQLSPCGAEKALQTNAVIFRKGRFTKVGEKHVWQAWANKNDECVRNNQARTRGVMIKLHDKIADKDVTVASVHWSTSQGGGPDPACAEKNIEEVDQKLHKAGYEADLLIFGGDFNESDRKDGGEFRDWYHKANGDDGGKFNWRDPVYRACQADKLQACLDDNWTIGNGNRIDAVFGQTGAGCRAKTRRAHTITFDEGDAAAKEIVGSDAALNYSDHRAIRAEFYY